MTQTAIQAMYSLLMIIPFHGIFVSIFFFFYSERKVNRNLLLGFLVLVSSLLTIIQIHNLQTRSCILFHLIGIELLICPFIFLYTLYSIFYSIQRIGLYVYLIVSDYLLFLAAIVFDNSWLMTVTIILNIGFLSIALLLLIRNTKKDNVSGLLNRRSSTKIIIMNIMFLLPLIVNAGLISLLSCKSFYPVQLLKGLAIYYVYYQIMAAIER